VHRTRFHGLQTRLHGEPSVKEVVRVGGAGLVLQAKILLSPGSVQDEVGEVPRSLQVDAEPDPAVLDAGVPAASELREHMVHVQGANGRGGAEVVFGAAHPLEPARGEEVGSGIHDLLCRQRDPGAVVPRELHEVGVQAEAEGERPPAAVRDGVGDSDSPGSEQEREAEAVRKREGFAERPAFAEIEPGLQAGVVTARDGLCRFPCLGVHETVLKDLLSGAVLREVLPLPSENAVSHPVRRRVQHGRAGEVPCQEEFPVEVDHVPATDGEAAEVRPEGGNDPRLHRPRGIPPAVMGKDGAGEVRVPFGPCGEPHLPSREPMARAARPPRTGQ
jgi:hypothetical protein